jgi:hypothetical protein
MKKENIHIYVFEDARLDGAKNKSVQQIIKAEINMADENRSVSGKK